MIADAIRKVTAGISLTQDEAETEANALMDGEATSAQMAALLVGLRMKGETVSEVIGFVRAMRARVVPVTANRAPLLDTCGTGGSHFRVFNVSTAAALAAAAAGIAVAKHGNRASSGTCGSADVLESLGVKVNLGPERIAACIETVGIGFLFAPAHHPAMKQVGPTRKEIGIRTIFNLVGPLTNPASATRQVMGVYDSKLCRLAAETLRELGSERALVLHGDIGLDEIATFGNTYCCELRDGAVYETILTPESLGLSGSEPLAEHLAPGATPADNAEILREVLFGTSQDAAAVARRTLVAVNAGAALYLSGLADSWPDATRQANAILLSGAAGETLNRLIAFTNDR